MNVESPSGGGSPNYHNEDILQPFSVCAEIARKTFEIIFTIRESDAVHLISFPLFHVSAARQRQFLLRRSSPLHSVTHLPLDGAAYFGDVFLF